MPITFVPCHLPLTGQVRASRKVPGAGADLYVKLSDLIDALRVTGHNSAAEYLDEAWKNINF